MMYRHILTFELSYQLRSATCLVYFFVAMVIPFWFSAFAIPSDDAVYVNSPFFLITATVFTSIVWLLSAGAIAGNAAARDGQLRMDPLIYTTAVSKKEYLGGRFMAAFLINALIHLVIPISFFLSFYIRTDHPGQIGPNSLQAYLTTYLYLSLPLAFYVTAFQFSVSIVTRKAIMAILASFFLFPIFSQLTTNGIADLSGISKIYDLFELVGLSVIKNIEILTPYEQNNYYVQLQGVFLWNRLIWFTIAIVLIVYSYRRFDFIHPKAGQAWKLKWKPSNPKNLVSDITVQNKKNELPALPSFGASARFSQMLAIARSSFQYVVGSKLGLSVVAIYTFLLVFFAEEFLKVKGIPLYATTMNLLPILSVSLDNILTGHIVFAMLIVFFAGELIWRERGSVLNRISDTMPVSEWHLFVGKFLGLGLLILLWMGSLLLAGILIQVLSGQPKIEFAVLFQGIFLIQYMNYLYLAILSLSIHVIVNNKYIGHLTVLILYLVLVFSGLLGLEHKLLVFGSQPEWTYTDMRGFSPYLKPMFWYKLYWSGWALVFAVIASLFFVRNLPEGFRERLQGIPQRFSHKTGYFTLLGLTIITFSGGYILYNTHLLNNYIPSNERVKRQAAYETNYRKFLGFPQPRLTATKIHVEIYPNEKKVEIHGNYKLVNLTVEPIDSIFVDIKEGVETANVKFNTPFQVVSENPVHGFNIYKLLNPILPGDSMEMDFDVLWHSKGFPNSGMDVSVIENGTYFISQDRLPDIRYNLHRELRTNRERKKHNLSDWSLPSIYDPTSRQVIQGQEMISFEAVVGTVEGQTAIAPGNLIKEWKDKGRSYFHYASNRPIRNLFSIFSANYEKYSSIWEDKVSNEDVKFTIYYHREHSHNLETIVKSVDASLSYYTSKYAKYPNDHLTLVERSGSEGELNAEPTAINFGEPFTLLNQKDNHHALDLIFFAIAHEIAHQWWGAGQLIPAASEGGIVMSESLANYSALKVVEEYYGDDQVNLLLHMWKESYEIPRNWYMNSLLEADEPFLGYRKGVMAMRGLSRYINPDTLNNALRKLIREHGRGEPPLPNTLDLYTELKSVTPDSLHMLLGDYFEKNLFWQLKTEQAITEKIAEGRWKVTLNVNVNKFIIDNQGNPNEEPVNDWIEIGVYSKDTNKKPLYLEKHLFKVGMSTITFEVTDLPSIAGIDPNHLLFDTFVDDNLKGVKVMD